VRRAVASLRARARARGANAQVDVPAWIGAAIAERDRLRRDDPSRAREDLIREHAPERSFLDVGAMWGIDGGMSFLAEDVGAAAVTAIDLTPPTAAYLERHARQGSRIRFVQGDLNAPETLEEAGTHDIVWCTGVLYHVPHPLLTLERLASVCGEYLMLGTQTIPEVPGLPHACVYWPHLPEDQRLQYTRDRPGYRVGLTDAFRPEQGYGAWWWGISPSALRAMVATTGFEVLDAIEEPFHSMLLARRTG
jgi:hypothetical protein